MLWLIKMRPPLEGPSDGFASVGWKFAAEALVCGRMRNLGLLLSYNRRMLLYQARHLLHK